VSVLFRHADVAGSRVDVLVADGRVGAWCPAGEGARQGVEVIDAGGGALIPGLHDHHIHLLALAAARRSVRCGPPEVRGFDDLAAALAAADRAAAPTAWIRGVGYHETVAGDLDRRALDRLVPARPCRVQHRSGHAWSLNSAALRSAGITASTAPSGVERDVDGQPTGRIFGLDAWLRARVPPVDLDLAAVGAELASYGVTGVTDATPTDDAHDVRLLAAAVANGTLPQRVVVTGAPALATEVAPELERGPVKLVIADHALPALDALVAGYRAARRRRRAVAVHCVTREALVLALAAWDEVGAHLGDRIEHGAVIPLDLIPRIVDLGLTVVTQPAFVADRGDDYRRDVDPADQPDLWRCASLQRAAVPVAAGTDAPFGPADPWRAVAAAMDRRTASGAVLGDGERLTGGAALTLFLGPLDSPRGPARRVGPGLPADLCLLDRPLAAALGHPSSDAVRLVMVAGKVIHGR
jgi:predicted amidohydrolase YtcJ